MQREEGIRVRTSENMYLDREEQLLQDWESMSKKRARSGSDNDIAVVEQPASKHLKCHAALEDNHEHAKSSSMTKPDPRTVGNFMAKHIPAQYAPQGKLSTSTDAETSESNTKFCYRHRPDKLCRRQADEPSMDKLQRNLDKLSENDRKGIVQVWSLFSAAPSKHRNLMLQGILTQCCFPQLSFLSGNVQKLIKIDFLAALPPEISFRILSSLDTISLCKAAQVSRVWRTLADDDVVWHRMCEQHIDRKCTKCGWGLPLLDRKRLRASKRQMQLRAAGHSPSTDSPMSDKHAEAILSIPPPSRADSSFNGPIPHTEQAQSEKSKVEDGIVNHDRKTRPWKEVYRDRFRVGKNWKHGLCSTRILKGHTNGIMALHIFDNYLATGSYDNTIKIWNLDTGEELQTLRGHTMGVRCLQMDDTKLISGSIDRTVKVWDWRSGICRATFTGHSSEVIGLQFDSHILVSGSADGTAIVRDMKNRSVSTLRGHRNWVNSVRIDGPSGTVFTASDDFTVKLWDLETKRCIRTFEGHVGHVQQVVLLPREFDAEEEATVMGDHVSDPGSPGTSSSTYSALDRSPELAYRSLPCMQSHHDAYQSTFADGRPEPPQYMLTSALDNTIRMWDVSTGRCIRTFFGHVEGVWALAADSLRIVSGAQDRMLKVWDPRTGKCERTFTGHTGPVTCIGLSDSRMCSAGEDGEVRVYCFSDPS